MKKLVPIDATLVPAIAKRVYKGVIFDVYQWQQPMFDGTPATFEMIRRPDTVEVICVHDGKILILEEEQPHSGKRVGFPGGRVDPEDDSLLAAAKREIKEETGLEFNEWRLIAVQQPITKGEWFVHAFLAVEQTSQASASPDNGEEIKPKWLGFDETKRLTKNAQDINEYRALFDGLHSIDDLINIPEFTGQEIER